MALRMRRNGRYWTPGSHRRFHVDWEMFEVSVEEDVNDVMVARGRANFSSEPTRRDENAKFAEIEASVQADRARQANRLNQLLLDRFGQEWVDIRMRLFQWLSNNPTATAQQARAVLEVAYPDIAYDPAKLLARLLEAFDPPFADWDEFRDYVVANYATVSEEGT